MNRRAVGRSPRPGVDEKFRHARAGRLVRLRLAGLVAIAAVFLALPAAPISAIEAPPDETDISVPADEPPSEPVATTPPVETRPPITANDFIPEERDLTSCIGVLERPGCGSESRGGWHQTLTLVAIFGGLAIVFGNVILGVRRNRRQQQS